MSCTTWRAMSPRHYQIDGAAVGGRRGPAEIIAGVVGATGCHDVAAQVEVESSVSHFSLNTLSSRRFQRGFDSFNLHRLTMSCTATMMRVARPRGTAPPTAEDQGLTLVHFSAQPDPFLTRNKPCTPPHTPSHPLIPPHTP